MADTKVRHVSPRRPKRYDKVRPATNEKAHTGRGGKRAYAGRRQERTGCHNPEVRKGVGAVIFTLGIPTAIGGIVLTVVSATDNENDRKYPSAFSIVGPILLFLAVLLFFIGFTLTSPIVSNALHRCFAFDDPNSFCRVHLPRLSHLLKPDSSAMRSRAAMDALKTEPIKSAMKRKPPPNLPGDYPEAAGKDETDQLDSSTIQDQQQRPSTPRSLAGIDFVSEKTSTTRAVRTSVKGVRFSDSDHQDIVRPRIASTSSDSSVFSTRNCKVHPEEGVWMTDPENSIKIAKEEPEHITTEL